MTDKQLETLYKIKDLCCEKIKRCTMLCVCSDCPNQCIENKIVVLINEVLND